jgi:hypothetical protein
MHKHFVQGDPFDKTRRSGQNFSVPLTQNKQCCTQTYMFIYSMILCTVYKHLHVSFGTFVVV